MASCLRELQRLSSEAGCTFVRQGRGDHDKWYCPLTGRNVTVDHGSRSRHTANETLKQAGLPKAS